MSQTTVTTSPNQKVNVGQKGIILPPIQLSQTQSTRPPRASQISPKIPVKTGQQNSTLQQTLAHSTLVK